MTIEDALYSKLSGVAGVTALVGTRIYPDVIPQAQRTRPCLVYQQQDRDSRACLSGERNGIVRETFQFFIEGLERDDCAAVRDALEAAVDGTTARGLWGGASGVNVQGCILGTATASFEPPPDGSEDYRREALIDVTIIWKR